MADAALEFLLNNLKDVLVYHVKLSTEAKSEIENLEKDLRVFKGFLKNTVKMRRKDEETKALVQNIRDVVYEVEDVLDAFVTQLIEKKSSNYFKKFFQKPIDLHSIGNQVMAVKKKVEQAKNYKANLEGSLHKQESQEPEEVREPRKPKEMVGFVDVTNDLIDRLTKETTDLDVVSLTGMFGLGKSTVAWKIFNDQAIRYEFGFHIWLVVSQDIKQKDIFLEIFAKLTNSSITDEMRQKSNLELAEMVSECLESRSFLIVFDDVWSQDQWDQLRRCLPKNSSKGKVLITSRDEEVGKYASDPRPHHKLRFFDDDESWELLRLEALKTLDCPHELEGVGKQIARDCKGLPLAIVIIGGILSKKRVATDTSATKKAWNKVSTRVSASSLNDDPAARMNKFISLSYDKLPYHLRACFLYLGLFPEDYEIPASKLIRMWIAEGFIQHNDHSTLEETGEKYLDDLIHRNLIRMEKCKPDGKVKTCRIHDTLRDFCRKEAGKDNENFLEEIKFNDGVFSPSVPELGKYRRFSIHSNCLSFISLKPKCPCVRSFVCLSKDEFTLPDEYIPYILGAFKLLRVLDIKPITFPQINSDIYNLVHLRYLALSLNLSTLPSKFSLLWNIQTLVVNTTSLTLEVKADIWKMNHLRHFKTNASATLPKPSKDSKHGAELQTLGTISAESCTPDLFDRACNLKKLGIRGKLALLLEGNVEPFGSPGKMKDLEKLKLINNVFPRPASEGQLHSLPRPHQFPSKLRSLTLASTLLSWSYMSILGELENLEVLKLKTKAFMGSTWKAVDGGFRRLEFLLIEETDLSVWEASNHHFPELKGLALRNCQKLVGIPEELAGIASFKMLDLHVVSKSASSSAKKIQEAKKKTQAKGSAFKLTIFPPTD